MQRLSGILLVLISAASFGALAILIRLAFDQGLDSQTILFLRFSLAALLMALLLAARGERWPRGPALLKLVGMGALGYVGQSFLFLTALKYASSGLVALLLYLYPVFVAVLSMFVLGEQFTHRKGLALILALSGLALTIRPEGGRMLGVLLAVGAALVYSVYIIVGAGVMKTVSPIQSSAVIFASAGVVYSAWGFASGLHLPASAAGWWVIVGIVVIATVIPVVTFLAGLARVSATEASMLSTVEPVVTVLLAAWLFDERLTPLTLLGGALILAAVLLLAYRQVHKEAHA